MFISLRIQNCMEFQTKYIHIRCLQRWGISYYFYRTYTSKKCPVNNAYKDIGKIRHRFRGMKSAVANLPKKKWNGYDGSHCHEIPSLRNISSRVLNATGLIRLTMDELRQMIECNPRRTSHQPRLRKHVAYPPKKTSQSKPECELCVNCQDAIFLSDEFRLSRRLLFVV